MKWIITLLFPVLCLSFVSENKSVVATEFQLVLKKIKQQPSQDVADDLESINTHLQNHSPWSIKVLSKNAVYKIILSENVTRLHGFKINSVSYEKIQKKIRTNSSDYSDFSKWLISSILIDYKPYLKKDFIDKYQTIGFEDSQYSLSKEVRSKNKYFSKWLGIFLKTTPKEFENTINLTCLNIVKYMEKQSKILGFQKPFSVKNKTIIFAIDRILIPAKTSAPAPVTATPKPDSALKSIEINDYSPASKKIDQVLQKTEKGWKPK